MQCFFFVDALGVCATFAVVIICWPQLGWWAIIVICGKRHLQNVKKTLQRAEKSERSKKKKNKHKSRPFENCDVCCNAVIHCDSHTSSLVARVCRMQAQKLWQNSHARLNVRLGERGVAHTHTHTHTKRWTTTVSNPLMLMRALAKRCQSISMCCCCLQQCVLFFSRPELQIKLHESQQFIDAYVELDAMPSYFVHAFGIEPLTPRSR